MGREESRQSKIAMWKCLADRYTADRYTAALTGEVWSLSEQTVLRAHGIRGTKEPFQLPGKAKLDLESP